MTESPLQRLARRASTEPSFLGWQLAAFARVRELNDEALAAYLGCPVETLANVRLCGAIRHDHFREDVMCVATTFGLRIANLAEVAKPLPTELLREAVETDTLTAMLAARDRSEPS